MIKTDYSLELQKTYLSIVFRLIDANSGNEPVGKVNIILKQTGKEAKSKSGGFYYFTDLKDGTYQFSIESEYYRKKELTKNFPQPPRWKVTDVPEGIVLEPLPSFPYSQGTTMFRGFTVKKEGDKEIRVDGTKVTGSLMIPGCSQELEFEVKAETKEIKLNGPSCGFDVDNILFIRDYDTSFREYSSIQKKLPSANDDFFELKNNLKYGHLKGTKIYLMKPVDDPKIDQSNQSSEFVILFKNLQATNFLLNLNVAHKDYKDNPLLIEMVEGSTTYKKIALTPK